MCAIYFRSHAFFLYDICLMQLFINSFIGTNTNIPILVSQFWYLQHLSQKYYAHLYTALGNNTNPPAALPLLFIWIFFLLNETFFYFSASQSHIFQQLFLEHGLIWLPVLRGVMAVQLVFIVHQFAGTSCLFLASHHNTRSPADLVECICFLIVYLSPSRDFPGFPHFITFKLGSSH